MTHRKDLKRIVDAGTAVRHSIYSDHRAIFMKIRIARNLPKSKKVSIGRVSRRRLVDPEARAPAALLEGRTDTVPRRSRARR